MVTHCAGHISSTPGWDGYACIKFRDRALTLRQVACAGRTVPPPIVPISTEGMVQDM